MKHIALFLLFSLFLFPAKAMETDSLQVSLLTVLPRSNEVYTIFGHTALRVHDSSQNLDMVFNWGTFDFNAPYFIYHFVKGETDYYLSYSPYDHFLYSYSMGNADIVEQTLDLPAEGKACLMQKLAENMRPENVVYRYNFLFDNCTTRVRDLIESCSQGQLTSPQSEEKVTFRQLIHTCTQSYPWLAFGIDLLIGSGADSLINARQTMFLPEQLLSAVDKTAFVTDTRQVLQAVKEPVAPAKFWDSPAVAGYLLLTFYCIIAITGWVKKRPFKGIFAFLYLVGGLAGCLVAFVSFFSDHPCVSPNWNLLWLHPLHLIAFAGCFWGVRFKILGFYHYFNVAILTILLLGWQVFPQAFHTADIPYILCLWLASSYWLSINKIHRQA
ncbi:MAG: DUF4105 domain-containing protein [Candidatus Symbiothrix sp.]|jgi:hypothetical protein|nr:DUF4105 domain-containing protein [Candidatus Symbiothrix sp.]